ncbi:MAG: P-loop NTPase fold protein [Bacteroidetes bacterium]|nr:P-loop NTPase fold protein [Bacteroidota bacterium]
MEYNYRKVSINANFLSDAEIENCRVDRDDELNNIIHLITKVNENVLLTGDRGQGKTYLSRLFENTIKRNSPEIFSFRIDLSSLELYSGEINYIKILPALILDQLCKEIWVNLFKHDYSTLLNMGDNPDKMSLFSKKAEQRLIEIHNINAREQQKIRSEIRSMLSLKYGVKSDPNTIEQFEWQNSTIQTFEILELIKEIKNTILKKYSKTKIVLICDEADKLTEKEQYHLLKDYLDFFGANQFNFLIVVANYETLKSTAEQSRIFQIVELKGFANRKFIKELICKSFKIEKFKIEENIYDILFHSFSGHLRYTLNVFGNCINSKNAKETFEIDIKTLHKEIKQMKERIKTWNSSESDKVLQL